MTKSSFSRHAIALQKFLASERVRAKLTQTELAAKLKRPQSFVSKIERGERRLDLIEFVEFANALGVSPKAVFGRWIHELDHLHKRGG